MDQRSPRHGQAWTPEEEEQLQKLVKQNTPTRLIGLKLQRTEESVRSKAQQLGVSLKPVNQSPYG